MCYRITRHKGRVPNRRSGSAAIEMVFLFPFVMALLLLSTTIAGMTLTRMELVTSVRHDAWSGRHHPWQPSDRYFRKTLDVAVPQEVRRILGRTQRWPVRAAVAARDSREMPAYLAGLEDAFPDAQYEHAVLAGSWDHKEIPFEPRAQHRRLEPTDRVYCFYDGPLSFAPFKAMAAFASADSLAGQQAARQNHEEEHRRQQEELQRQRQEILAMIAAKQRELEQLRDQLAMLENQDPRDEAAIERTRNQIDQVEGDIKTLQEALSSIDQANQAAPN